MPVKVGDEFISLDIGLNGRFDWETHIVRTIRGGSIYAVHKNVCTWGRLSKRHGDFGWLPSFSDIWRTQWRVGDPRPPYLSKTKLQAVRYAMKRHGRIFEPEDYDSPEIYEKILPRLKKLETRLRQVRALDAKNNLNPGNRSPAE